MNDGAIDSLRDAAGHRHVSADAKHVRLSFSLVTRVSRTTIVCAVTIVAVAAMAQQAQIVEPTVEVQLLAINDFHGGLEPTSGGTGRIGATNAGGIEYLATHLRASEGDQPQYRDRLRGR